MVSSIADRGRARPWYYRTDEEVLAISREDGGRPLRSPGPKGGCHFMSGFVPSHGRRCKRTKETCDLRADTD